MAQIVTNTQQNEEPSGIVLHFRNKLALIVFFERALSQKKYPADIIDIHCTYWNGSQRLYFNEGHELLSQIMAQRANFFPGKHTSNEYTVDGSKIGKTLIDILDFTTLISALKNFPEARVSLLLDFEKNGLYLKNHDKYVKATPFKWETT